MIRFLLNAILAFVALRFVFGIARFLGGGDSRHLGDAPRDQVPHPRKGSGGAREEGRFEGTDRASVIDVPFTEVEPADGETADAGQAGSGERRP